jgi:hypothetical protein
MRRHLSAVLVFAGGLAWSLPAIAQDSNIHFPVDLIEHRLKADPFVVSTREGSRFETDRTQRVILSFADNSAMMVKWARAPIGGEEFNNQPRYEVAAYLLQKMFLDEKDYVVPPTLLRAFPTAWYRQYDAQVKPTFDPAASVVVALQYWLGTVTARDVYDPQRLQSDSAYARHFANMNVLTYLIDHKDSNQGNVLVSENPANPRLFSVDNGVAFASRESNRGTEWRTLRTRRLPHGTVERLRAIQREDLDRVLGVVAQFELREGELVAVEPTDNLNRKRGVRRGREVVQLGLTSAEIQGVHRRLEALLRQVDSGKIATF